jgi:23S rRNA pseudouridine2605 synthase
MLIRLQKLISRYGFTSRRKAEELIKSGRVSVNGVVQDTLGKKVPSQSEIVINGHVINKSIPRVYILLNKPRKYLCSKHDPFGRKLIYSLLDEKYKSSGIFSVGRLDFMSEGLLLLTNDGYFAQMLSHPSGGILKKYDVTVDKSIPYKSIDTWKNGLYIKGIKYTIENYRVVSPCRVIICLKEGKNREIRRLFEDIHRQVVRLRRIAIGFLEIHNLPPGKYRELTQDEVENLISNCSTLKK